MSRFRLPIVFGACLPIAALCGCGGAAVPKAAISETAVISAGAPPVTAPSSVSTLEDQAIRSTLQATDSDGDALTFSITRPPAHAAVSLDVATGDFELQPAANYFGADTFEFAVSDGHGNAASARVEVMVTAEQDPPVIDTAAMSSVVAAGRDAQIRLAISDPDGDAVDVSVSQVGGTAPLTDLRVTGEILRFLAPEVDAATDVELLIAATDQTGLSTSSRAFITISPVSASGKVFTVQGHPHADGLHWVITGDGFTADQQQDLLRAAVAMAKSVTEAPELAPHARVLNVHVLAAVSEDSGVVSHGTRGHRTAFNATLGCSGVERVACLNWDRVFMALMAERVPFDAVGVVLNTDVYVGSASASGLIVSRHPLAPAITLHEMGHLLAGLGDEYVDENAAGNLGRGYREGKFPNVTTISDPSLIPWRHWFTDPARIPAAPGEAGVGRFEGAFYSAHGFYRPTHDSVMRTLGGAMGAVNTEAWLRALYRAVPPVSAAYPGQRVVTGHAGEWVEFEIASPWPAELLSIRWFVDGVEVESERGPYGHILLADGLRHEVRVSIEDDSGAIRDPAAREQKSSVIWTVSNERQVDARKAQLQPPRIGGWIRMHVDSSGHSVVGVIPVEPQLARFPRAAAEPELEYALYDGEGMMIAKGGIADPRVIHGPLPRPGEPETGHALRTLESGDYLIGVPDGADARRLRIRRSGSMEKAGQSEQWLDL